MDLVWIIVAILIVIAIAWAVVGLTLGQRDEDDDE